MITSKNVGLLARTKADVKTYPGGQEGARYTFAVEMANVWFDKLATMTMEKQ